MKLIHLTHYCKYYLNAGGLFEGYPSEVLENDSFDGPLLSPWTEWYPNGQPARLGVDGFDVRSGKSKL
jgi:hypothetical protein